MKFWVYILIYISRNANLIPAKGFLYYSFKWSFVLFNLLKKETFGRHSKSLTRWQDFTSYMAEEYPPVHHISFISSWVHRQLVQSLTVINRTVINMRMKMPLRHIDFTSFGYIPSSDVTMTSHGSLEMEIVKQRHFCPYLHLADSQIHFIWKFSTFNKHAGIWA